MKRLLLIGNGFDLAHKLPTRYADFLYVIQKYIGKEIKEICDYRFKRIDDTKTFTTISIKYPYLINFSDKSRKK